MLLMREPHNDPFPGTDVISRQEGSESSATAQEMIKPGLGEVLGISLKR